MAENAELLPTADDVAVEEVVTDLMLQETREADQGAEGQGVSTDGTIGLAASSNPADTLLGGGAMSAAANSMMPQSMERSPAASEPANSAKVEGLENGEDHASSSAATKVVGGGENEHSREVPAETDLELLARHKTKEQEIVESEEVVARMERIEQRSRLGFTGEDAKAEGQGAPEEEKQEEEEEEEVSSQCRCILSAGVHSARS